ncbi:MAG: class 1 fructose-bisphosphatase [Deltaproteobacteria bacterium]
MERPIITVQQHILDEQQSFPGVSGEFSWLLSGITLATKMIQAKVRRAGLSDILGSEAAVNVQGEVQQKLDVYANNALLHCLGVRDSVGVLASEENEEPVALRASPRAKYAIVFDPLDGSSNIDVNVSVGTIFSILRRPESSHAGTSSDPLQDLLQPGSRQVAAGYVVYGSSTILVYTTGRGVHGFTLDPSVGAYVLSHENIRMPARGKYYSANEAYRDDFPAPYRRYLDGLRKQKYASRYIGSLVADFHRTLLKGGVFLYPPTAEHPRGKLRLLYEANPMAFIAEQAGGAATDGTRRILEIEPASVHERTPLVVGSHDEMAAFAECLRER